MAHEAKMNGDRQAAESPGVLRNVSSFGGDLFSLSELQARLAALETREAIKHSQGPVLRLGIAATIAITALPLLYLGLAEAISSWLGWSRTVVLLGLTLGLIAFSFTLMWRSLDELRGPRFRWVRSREELIRNWNWVKTVISRSGRGFPYTR
jgi:hypothetical protein